MDIGTEGAIVGNLRIPSAARGLVIFAHGSGSSRFSRRNRYVADVLERASLATLLIDLLTVGEEAIDHRNARFRRARTPGEIAAIVSRGGRAEPLLIVGGADSVGLGLNEEAMRRMCNAPVELAIVPGATPFRGARNTRGGRASSRGPYEPALQSAL